MPTATPETLPSALEQLARDERGALSIEYLVLTAVGFVIVAGLAALGVAMVTGYGGSLQYLYSEYP